MSAGQRATTSKGYTPTLDANVAGLHIREYEVLAGLADGLTRAQIGERHSLSPNTVISYRNRLFKRLDVHTAYEALVQGWRRGILRECPTCRRPR